MDSSIPSIHPSIHPLHSCMASGKPIHLWHSCFVGNDAITTDGRKCYVCLLTVYILSMHQLQQAIGDALRGGKRGGGEVSVFENTLFDYGAPEKDFQIEI